MFVGARPWQILHPSESAPEYDPELELPFAIRSSLFNDQMIQVNVDVLPLWRTLSPAVKRIGAAVALDMASVKLQGHVVYQEVSPKLERLTNAIVDRPHEPLRLEALYMEIFETIPEEFQNPENPFRNIFDAVEQFFDGLVLNSVFSSLTTFCYSPSGPLDLDSELSPNIGNIETAHLFVVYHDGPLLYRQSDADEFGHCLRHWINIWWQEVLDTLAFVLPKSKGRIFRA